MRVHIHIAYDGTNYAGWQIQRGERTIQETLSAAIEQVCRGATPPTASGRTDAGVHAVAQSAHFDYDAPRRLPPSAILRGINSRLPPDIRIVAARYAAENFHARFDVRAKEYRYYVSTAEIMLPHLRLYALHNPRALDLRAMRRAAKAFVGVHDFRPFMANPLRDMPNTTREIYEFAISKRGDTFCFRVKGSGFLYKQVRSMVGFLLRVGSGRERPEAAAEILRDLPPRSARIPTAPARGLFLHHVWY